MIKNVNIYGLDNSFRVSKFPMSVSADCNSEITDTIKKLASTPMGEGHDNFLCGIVVQFDLTFTIKAWTEAERYHFLDIVSSQSTMHRIAKFDTEKQCNEYVSPMILIELKRLKDIYNAEPTAENYLRLLYNVPVGFKLTAGITTNYRQLKTIYQQRKNHRLPEWRAFCEWIESLPYAEELLCTTLKK